MTDVKTFLAEEDNGTILLVGIDRAQFFLYRGEDHINQLLLMDGSFPKPVRCLHFASLFEARMVLGEAVNVSAYWGIHPKIVDRLREEGDLTEIDG